MGQIHEIIKLWNTRILNSTVSQLIPGGVHHGGLLDEDAPRPYGLIDVKEEKREYNSGGGSVADYEVSLTVYSKQKVGVSGNVQEQLGILFNPNSNIIFYDSKILAIVPRTGDIVEDDNTIDGTDVIKSNNKWLVKIEE